MTRSIGRVVMVAAVLGVVGCGSGGGPALPAPATASSGSFSPSTATTSTGEPVTELWWKHRMNGGTAMVVSLNGIPGTLKVGDRLSRVIDGGTRRLTTFNLTFTANDPGGPITSNASNTLDEKLMAGPPSATVKQTIQQDQQVTGQGMSLHIALNLAAMPSMPMVDFGDRADLDQLPVGHVDEVMVTTVTTGTVTASASGAAPDSMVIDSSSADHNVWTIQEQLPSMTVLGKTYSRVVKVLVTGESTDLSTGDLFTQSNTYWLAAGIGVVKATTVNSNSPLPMTAELLETNLGL